MKFYPAFIHHLLRKYAEDPPEDDDDDFEEYDPDADFEDISADWFEYEELRKEEEGVAPDEPARAPAEPAPAEPAPAEPAPAESGTEAFSLGDFLFEDDDDFEEVEIDFSKKYEPIKVEKTVTTEDIEDLKKEIKNYTPEEIEKLVSERKRVIDVAPGAGGAVSFSGKDAQVEEIKNRVEANNVDEAIKEIQSLIEKIPDRAKNELKSLIDSFFSIKKFEESKPEVALSLMRSFFLRGQPFSNKYKDIFPKNREVFDVIQTHINTLGSYLNDNYQGLYVSGLGDDFNGKLAQLEELANFVKEEFRKDANERNLKAVQKGLRDLAKFKKSIYAKAKDELFAISFDHVISRIAEITDEIERTIPVALKILNKIPNLSREQLDLIIKNLLLGHVPKKLQPLRSKFLKQEQIDARELEILAQLTGLTSDDLLEIREESSKAQQTMLDQFNSLNLIMPGEEGNRGFETQEQAAEKYNEISKSLRATEALEADEIPNELINSLQLMLDEHEKYLSQSLENRVGNRKLIVTPMLEVFEAILNSIDDEETNEAYREEFGNYFAAFFQSAFESDSGGLDQFVDTLDYAPDEYLIQTPGGTSKKDPKLRSAERKRWLEAVRFKRKPQGGYLRDESGNRIYNITDETEEEKELREAEAKRRKDLARNIEKEYVKRRKESSKLFLNFQQQINTKNTIIINWLKRANEDRANEIFGQRETKVKNMLPEVLNEASDAAEQKKRKDWLATNTANLMQKANDVFTKSLESALSKRINHELLLKYRKRLERLESEGFEFKPPPPPEAKPKKEVKPAKPKPAAKPAAKPKPKKPKQEPEQGYAPFDPEGMSIEEQIADLEKRLDDPWQAIDYSKNRKLLMELKELQRNQRKTAMRHRMRVLRILAS